MPLSCTTIWRNARRDSHEGGPLAETGSRSGGAERFCEDADELLHQSLDYTRSLVSELTPQALYERGLGAASDGWGIRCAGRRY